jgi:hypothetical protein
MVTDIDCRQVVVHHPPKYIQSTGALMIRYVTFAALDVSFVNTAAFAQTATYDFTATVTSARGAVGDISPEVSCQERSPSI